MYSLNSDKGTASHISLTIQKAQNKIDIFKWPSVKTAQGTVLILANSYGVLRYCKQLGKELSNINYDIYSFNGRGQGDVPGFLTLQNAAEDLDVAINAAFSNAKKKGHPLMILCHCAGIYSLLENLANGADYSFVNRLVIYSYLHDPNRLKKQVLKKMSKLQIRTREPFFDFDRDYSDYYKFITMPTTIVHPTIPSSLARATAEEVENTSLLLTKCNVIMPNFGYELFDNFQKAKIERFVKNIYVNCFNISSSF